jgi:hypothetical protein
LEKKEKGMKLHILLIIGFLFSTHQIHAQITEKQLRKLERQEANKEMRKKQQEMTSKMLENRTFVLEANYLSNNRGARSVVSSTINFIKVDEGRAVIQIGNDRSMGYNGVGGVTAEGEITSWELHKNKKGSYSVTFRVMTTIGHYDIRMNISDIGSARATLSGLHYGSLTYEGNLTPVETSRVYKGRSL